MATTYLREALDRFAIDPARTVLSIANNHIGDQGIPGRASPSSCCTSRRRRGGRARIRSSCATCEACESGSRHGPRG
jgi:hypothetical protein